MMEKKIIEEFDRKQQSKKKKKRREASSAGGKSKQAKVEEPEFAQPSSSYRDRAQERREGLNKDFELIGISNPEIDDRYIGGDVEHTHLVKGLDFDLLKKVKSEQELAEKLSSDKGEVRESYFGNTDSDSEEEEFRNEAILAASSLANQKRQIVDIEKLRKGQSTEIIPCRTAIARRILNVLDEKWPDKSELFMPGRMTYIIPIDEDLEDCNVTRIVRSKADSSIDDESGLPNESDFAFDQLVNILSNIRQR